MKTTKLIHAVNARTIHKTAVVVLMLIFVILWPTWSNSRSQTNACWTGFAPGSVVCADSSNASLERLVDIIAIAEGAAVTNQVGDLGLAAGKWQLHKRSVEHVNQCFQTNYVWPDDALNLYRAREIVKLYLIICGYAKYDLEEVVRRYNGGYKYWRSDASGRYWLKVKTAIERTAR